jgi:DNA-binding XRE family transcriptional regulator
MKVWINGKLRRAHLTTEHAASSYGRPMLVVEGEAFSPFDAILNGISVAVATQHERESLVAAGYHLAPEPWGLRLRRARLELGLTQAQLAARSRLSQSEIARLEARNHPPSTRIVVRLEGALYKKLI